MLNYNYNIIGAGVPFGSGSLGRGSNYKPRFNWDAAFRTSVASTDQQDSIAGGSFTINGIYSDVYNITSSKGGTFEGSEDTAYTASISGSGVWPTTGSTVMQLYIAAPGGTVDNAPYYYSAAVSYSAAVNNGSVSGSKLSNSFTASKNFIYFVSGSIIHYKGNQYNPLVNWIASGSTPNSRSLQQGPLAQFNVVKDQNVAMVSVPYVTSSISGAFYNDYAFNITASLTGSSNWAYSGSHLYPTMSLSIPEVGITRLSYTTASLLTASFSASTNSPYTITASAWANYIPDLSASFVAISAGGAGFNNPYYVSGSVGGAGGGGGAYYETSDFSIIPNVYYTFNVGTASKQTEGYKNGQATILNGYAKRNGEIVTMSITLTGGKTGTNSGAGFTYGGDSGTRTLIFGSSYAFNDKRNGGTGSWNPTQGGTGGGGASFSNNGGNQIGSVAGAGGNGYSSSILGFIGGGGGGAGWDLNPYESYRGAGGTGGGGNGGDQSRFPGDSATSYGAGGGGGANSGTGQGFGSDGILTIRYSGKPRLTFTGTVVTETLKGTTTHYIHSGSGTFIYNYEPNPYPNPQESWGVQTLLIGGGGAGAGDIGAGGGAGGYLLNPNNTYINYTSSYTIKIGAGAPNSSQISGSNTYLINNQTGETFVAYGGGTANYTLLEQYPSGSGGGGNRNTAGANSLGQGNSGGNGSGNTAGGGGGAGSAGGNGILDISGGAGGLGIWDLSLVPKSVAGGGNALNPANTASVAYGGGVSTILNGNALDNTGGGGAGLEAIGSGGKGGSGKVQIKYPGNPIGTGGIIETGYSSGSLYTVHTFLTDGTFTPNPNARPVVNGL